MTSTTPIQVICHYRVRAGQEQAYTDLLRRHWPTLRELGLATEVPARAFQGTDRQGRPEFFETFQWQSEQASRTAHETPQVMAIWEPMGGLCEEREGRPSMEFHHVRELELGFGA